MKPVALNKTFFFLILTGVTVLSMILPGCGSKKAPLQNRAALSFVLSDQTFEPQRTQTIGAGDLDKDGDIDVVFSNMGFFGSKVLLNDGKGYFVDSGQKLTQQGHGVGIGDLDGDRDLDLFITCAGYRESQDQEWSQKPSKIYLNDGRAHFEETGQNLGDTELSGVNVTLHDIDRDGDLDALVVYYPEENKIYLNDGKARFTDSNKHFPDVMIWGDFDSDGTADVFVKELGIGYKTLLNDGTGTLSEFWSLEDSQTVRSYGAAGDIDNDGDLDIVMTNGGREEADPTKVFLNDGTGRFADSSQALFPANVGRVGLGDLNGDNYLDAVIMSLGKPNPVWVNDGKGHFLYSGISLDDKNAIHSCVFEDFDSDGDIDIFLGNFLGGSNQLWINQMISNR